MDFFQDRCGVQLTACLGISIPKISEQSIIKFTDFCSEKDDFYIVALEAAATVAKSTAIAVALLDGFIDTHDAIKCSRFEENLQIEEFGKVDGTHDVDEIYETMVLSTAKNLVILKDFQILK